LHRSRNDEDASVRREVAELLSGCWKEVAIDHYYVAFQLALPEDRRNKEAVSGWSEVVSHEAGVGFVRLVEARGARNDKERKCLADVKNGLKHLEEETNFFVTPIVFSLTTPKPLSG